jgi:hypothetical protein
VADAGTVLKYLKGYSPREYAVIRDRIVGSTATLEQLGEQFDVTRERIRQIEQKLRRRIHGILNFVDGQAIRNLAKIVREDLGSASPVESVSTYFSELCSSIESNSDRELVAAFLLWIAGPYADYGTWKITDRGLSSNTRDVLVGSQDNRGWLSPQTAREALLRADIRLQHHMSWLQAVGFFELDGGWLLRQSNIPDRVVQILRFRGVPITAEELLPLVDCETLRSLRSRLLDDDRFKRTTRQGHFALREWAQYDEYTGIADEIAQEITQQGGIADAQHIIDVVSRRYGVKPGSVQQYLSAPMFIKVDQRRVRLRAPDEARTIRSDPRLCPSLYWINEQWTFKVKITSETLRGSGRLLHPAIATLVGCQPGDRRVLKSPRDEIVISWPAGSASGPNLGSLKPDVNALGGAIDDYVFLTLCTTEVTVRLLRAADLINLPNDLQLALLVGLPSQTPDQDRLNAIASAIGLRVHSHTPAHEEIHGCLMRRNEVALARLIQMPDFEDPLAIFAQLENTLGLQ